MIRKRLPVAALLAAALFAGTTASARDVVVGATASVSGVYALAAQEQLRGFQLWIDDVNARGGLLGRKVALRYYDDESKPGVVGRLYDKLIAEDKVDLLIGPYSSALTAAAGEVVERHGFPMVSAGASASSLWTRGARNLIGIYAPASVQLDQVLAFAKEKGLRRVALIYEDSEFPRDVAGGVRVRAKALGMQLVFQEGYDKSPDDFDNMVSRLKTKRPDVILCGSYLRDSVAFMREAKKHKLGAKIIAFAVGASLPEFGKELELDAEGVMGASQWEPTLALPGVREFGERYKAKYGSEAGVSAAGGYAAGQVLETAVKKANSLDRDALRAAIYALDAPTVFGGFHVDGSGRQIGKPVYALQWIDGARHVVLPEGAATRKPAYPFRDWTRR